MKTHRKLLLSFLGTSFLLGGLGFASLRINSGIKQNTDYVIENSLSEVKAAKDMTQSLQSIQSSSQELLLEIDRQLLNNNESRDREEILRSQKIIQEQLSRFETALFSARKTTVFYIKSPAYPNKQTNSLAKEKKESEEFEWLEQIEKNFFAYKNTIDNYLVISETDQEKAYELLEEKLEPQVRQDLMPLVTQYQNDALEEMEEKA
ncbi:MAG: MCP four helix bundle domain-containing protein [Prochloraceae cyanobacterium]|nr:MCP four helix bundle domain-containing protein [Prochloraceae cyanobacterium]